MAFNDASGLSESKAVDDKSVGPPAAEESSADLAPTEEEDAEQNHHKRQRRESVSEKLTRELTMELGLTAQQVSLAPIGPSPYLPSQQCIVPLHVITLTCSG